MLTDKNLKRMLVPTLDIDLMWHTHQLWMYGYFHDCLNSPCHSAIDHNDKIEEAKLDNGFEYTSKAYKKNSRKIIQFVIVNIVLNCALLKGKKLKAFSNQVDLTTRNYTARLNQLQVKTLWY